ncbi:hypothetical protein L596_027480 [Steinernema carpocapsae]|uniref:Protein kinase domain-containing protein n=1 Tax=Steinernema carpocapsae TaxID=34508 RepID=A0A4U5LVM0_STECR|nr:hypothetical protein L596_027480 [Steinernema carpocapsae]
MKEEEGPVDLRLGKIVGKRWKIVDKLGEGGCGAVYLVEEVKTQAKAALKAESNFVAGGSVLKLEVQILRRLQGRKHVAQLFHSGRKEKYCYMVMTLFGHSLQNLFRQCNKQFTLSTLLRVGVHMLYGIKQLHEVGFVHRDIKPANLAVGRGAEAKIIHLLDFGLAREYVIQNNGKLEIRKKRENTLFRGTTKYCSSNTHTRNEQGRPDDLWSMVYVLAEFRGPLPWDQLREKADIGKKKIQTMDEELLAKCPEEMLNITKHLNTLSYYTRPDYHLIYMVFVDVMEKNDVKFYDPYDWEDPKSKPKGRSRRPRLSQVLSTSAPKLPSKIKTLTEDPSVKTLESAKLRKVGWENQLDPTMDDITEDEGHPFRDEDFSLNAIGF